MAKLRELVNRRKAIRNIAKITRTMELIATARFKKALDRASEAAAYTRKIAELAANLASSATKVSHPLLVKREPVRHALLLVISSNRGLCGGYNGGIIRAASARLRENEAGGIRTSLELSGKRAIAYFRFQRIPATNTFTQFEDKPAFDDVEVIANRYIELYVSGQVDRIDVCFQRFLNAARQIPTVETLLPLDSVTIETTPAKGSTPTTPQRPVEYEFMPDAQHILQELLPESFKVRLFKCFLDAAVSEQIARRVAMKAASENANDIIKSLSTQYNRARQAQITKEISEIIGGVEALK